MLWPTTRKLAACLAGSAALTVALFGTGAQASQTCDRVASPSGSDSASGTPAAPFRTVQKLSNTLSAGQTGCLRAGTYAENVKVTRGGDANAPATIRNYPGERAELDGRLWVAMGADHVTVEGLWLNGAKSSAPSPTVTANDTVFRGNDVTNDNTNICFTIGHAIGEPQYGRPRGVVLERNRIHNCGSLPANNHLHGIYVAYADDTRITGNWIYDNADRGIQLYPDAQGTTITGNVIDGNGQGVAFGGENGDSASNTTVEGNVITNSTVRSNVESYYPAGTPAGHDNVVRRNCIKGGARGASNGGVQSPEVGFHASDNSSIDPSFTARSTKDFRVRERTCEQYSSMLTASAGPDGPTTSTPGQGPAPTPRPTPGPRPIPRPIPHPRPQVHRRAVAPARHVRLSVTLAGRAIASSSRPTRFLRLKLRGRAGGGAGRKVLIQVHTARGWRVVARGRVKRSGRFALKRRVKTPRGVKSIVLRAVVPGIGSSAAARLAR